MDTKTLLQSDYLDIIFDKRNKAYGSYELRRNYNRRMKKAGLFALLGITAIFSFSFIAANSSKQAEPLLNSRATVVTNVTLPPPVVTPPPAIHTPPPSSASPKSQKFTPIVITNDPIKPEDLVSTVRSLTHSTPGLSTNDTGDVNPGIKSTGTKPVIAIITTTAAPTVPPKWVEQMPQYPGDMNGFLSSHIRYPEQARAANVQGRVIVQFVVSEDGTITNVQITKGLGAGCDEEAARVVSSMPKWKPGKQNGLSVKVLYALPISFRLDL